MTGKLQVWGYSGYGDAKDELAIDTTFGLPESRCGLIDGFNESSWVKCWQTPGGWGNFFAWTGPKCVSIPLAMTPQDWTDILGGSQDAALTTTLTQLRANGVQWIRAGKEVNIGSWAWSVTGAANTPANIAGYQACVAHIYTLAEKVAPGYFIFVYNPAIGGGATNVWTSLVPTSIPLPRLWVGYDMTAQMWGPWEGDTAEWAVQATGQHPNLDDLMAWVTAHPTVAGLFFPEIGLGPSTSGPNQESGIGDDPGWWNNFFAWCVPVLRSGINIKAGIWNLNNVIAVTNPLSRTAITAALAVLEADGLLA